jgi:hypothetical protein
MIAHCTEPDFVPNDYGEDPWWSAARSAQGDLSEQELQYLSAYLLARALGHRSRNPAELISIALDGVYLAAYQSRLSNAAWLLMERLLPWSFFWQDWDYCKRIRAGIVEAFLRRKLSPSVFAQVTVDDRLFFGLVQDAAEKGRTGRRFLKRVKRELLNSTDGNCSARIKIVSEFE